MISAVNYGGPKTRGRRGDKPQQSPLYDTAKLVADTLFERAMTIADELAPEVPADAEALDDWDQFNLLERVAIQLSPAFWDEPEALDDLFRLRRTFLGIESLELKELAKEAKQKRRLLPDAAITPQNDEFEPMMRRIGAA